MTLIEVKKYLTSNSIFEQSTVKKIGQGNNSDVFLITSRGEKFVLRAQKNQHIKESKLHNHYIILKYLEYENINFVSKPTLFDEKKGIFICTYLPGVTINDSNLTSRELNSLFKQLFKIQSLKFSKFKKFCKNNNFEIIFPENSEKSIKKYGTARLNNARRHGLDDFFIDWVKPRLKENIAASKKEKNIKKDIILQHGDLTGGNILKYKEKIFFIDWELARFSYAPDLGLAYMMVHNEFFLKKKKEIVLLCAKNFRINDSVLIEKINVKMKTIKLNDIIWAAEKYAVLRQNELRGWKKFMAMTIKRKREYVKMFEK